MSECVFHCDVVVPIIYLSLYISACSRVNSVLCVGHVSEGSSRCDVKNEEEKSWQLIAQVDDNNR